MSKIVEEAAPPGEVFPAWRHAQLEVDRLAREPLIAPSVLRTTGFLRPELAERVAEWFTGKPTAPTDAWESGARRCARPSSDSTPTAS